LIAQHFYLIPMAVFGLNYVSDVMITTWMCSNWTSYNPSGTTWRAHFLYRYFTAVTNLIKLTICWHALSVRWKSAFSIYVINRAKSASDVINVIFTLFVLS
jgi:hypothetical protein